MVSNDILLSVIELSIGIIVEGILLSMVFAYISNQSSEKQYNNIKSEMNVIENQNKFEFEQLTTQLENTKSEIISQIKESNYENQKGGKNI